MRQPKCYATGKRRYRTQLEAAIALGLARSAVDRKPGTANEERHYLCSYCHTWHLTSKPTRRKPMRGEQ